MDLKDIVEKRRAYRSLEHVEIDDDLVDEIAEYARISPSCFNNQPWRFVFVYDSDTLKEVFDALPKGNAWATHASMVIASISAICLAVRINCISAPPVTNIHYTQTTSLRKYSKFIQ